jgi:hypothetical protein
VVKAGAYKDIGNIARPMKPERQVRWALSPASADSRQGGAWSDGARRMVRAFADGRPLRQPARAPENVDERGGPGRHRAAAKLAGSVGRPLIYPRRRFSLRDLVQNRLGLDGAAQVLPALPALFSLRTPLYLMQ